jgi:hypothetical protein
MAKKYLLLLFLSLFSFNSLAEQCSVNFNYGVIIAPNHIRIIEHSRTIIQINGENQLFVEGYEIELTVEQQQLISQFVFGIREQVPEIVSIAIEGVDIGLKAVNKAIGSLTGENSASQQKIQTKFNELKWRIRTRFNQSANNYYIAPQDFADFDNIFKGDFEQEIEEIISNSIGTILLAVGEAMISDSSDKHSSEQRLSTFDERMETMGKGIELELTANTNALENKAEKFCLELTKLDKIENKIHNSIKQLKPFNLIETN